MPGPKTRENKRMEAEERKARWNAMTPEQQLSELEARGAGHCAQAERLRERLKREDG